MNTCAEETAIGERLKVIEKAPEIASIDGGWPRIRQVLHAINGKAGKEGLKLPFSGLRGSSTLKSLNSI